MRWKVLAAVAIVWGAAQAAPEAPSPLEAMKPPLKELGAFLSNASFKLKHGVSGVGGGEGGFSIQDCCAINMERMRGALDSLGRERGDLQRDLERGRNAAGIQKLDAFAVALRTFEEGYRLLGAVKRPDHARSVLDGLVKSFNALDAAHRDLLACCAAPVR
jgi:hypothetical protein